MVLTGTVQCEYTLSIAVDSTAPAEPWPLLVCKAKGDAACAGECAP